MAHVDVRIPAIEIAMCRDEMAYGQLLLTRLREAGIPVIGKLTFQGVENGELLQSKSDKLDYMIYRWVPGETNTTHDQILVAH
ncbi:hypothetical protein [Paludibacterium purpuratum]|uniref:Uncharacterized protein n=1 Tax=Paludibacterium purpuratum TaxID=1144873 RepID=A0A4R7BB67_9NEIS|nr:hypothetical protein [Paludibacterium purpuratum]TDR82194.1 hypothetical protein DFP86_102308 [Paludibacterium purpuratum]